MRGPESHSRKAVCILDSELKTEVSGPKEMTNCILEEESLTTPVAGGLAWILLVHQRGGRELGVANFGKHKQTQWSEEWAGFQRKWKGGEGKRR